MVGTQKVSRPSIRQWQYDPDALTLTHRKSKYEIDLEDINSAAEMLDMIVQISQKLWAGADTVAELVWAFDIILHPQETLCSGGRERGPIDVRRVVQSSRRRATPAARRRLGFAPAPDRTR